MRWDTGRKRENSGKQSKIKDETGERFRQTGQGDAFKPGRETWRDAEGDTEETRRKKQARTEGEVNQSSGRHRLA